MSEEVLITAYDVVYWRDRAARAEARAAELLIERDRAEHYAAAFRRVLTVLAHVGDAETARNVAAEMLRRADAGAALLAELEAARAVAESYQTQPKYYDDTWCDPGQNDPYYAWHVHMTDLVAAYDKVKQS